MRRGNMSEKRQEGELRDEVISISFHTKVTRGGRKLTCAALVAVGDGQGKVGLGYGKASGVPMAIEKGVKEGRANLSEVCLVGDTVGHTIVGKHGSTRVLLKPASPGTGVKAGSTVRAVLQVAGVHNVLSKAYGNTNPLNVAKATLNALRSIRSVEEVAELRGVDVRLFHPQSSSLREATAEAGQGGEDAD